MNWGIIGGLVLLVIWVIAALVMNGPGWVHLLLTVGVSLLVYGVVTRSPRGGRRAGGDSR